MPPYKNNNERFDQIDDGIIYDPVQLDETTNPDSDESEIDQSDLDSDSDSYIDEPAENDPKLEELLDAICTADCDKVIEMLTNYPCLISGVETTINGYFHETWTPIEAFISGTGTSEEHVNRIPMLSKLFEKGIIKPEHFDPKILMEFVRTHGSWPYQYDMLDTLIKYIPSEYWVKLRSKDGETILHSLVHSYMNNEKKDYYFKQFVDMGVDPLVLTPENMEIEETARHSYTVMKILIYDALPNCLKYVMSKFELNWTFFNETFDDSFDLDRANGMMSCLKTLSRSKNQQIIADVKETFRICVENGLDLNYTDKNGFTIYDYIEYYGWKPVLEDVVMAPENQNMEKFGQQVKMNKNKWKFNRTKKNLLAEVKKTKYPKIPLTEEACVAITGMEEFMKNKLRSNKYEKDPERIGQLEKEFLSYLEKIQAHKAILGTIHASLYNNYNRAYGFLCLPLVEKFFEGTDRVVISE
ncbi:MAG: hypothetical protein Satyrvirus36_10 [Satyrvirus sp.]|uniref:Uncharacterized protein n=1 Tax=Satyrvirus sp. TaxID=2487771 RepID=A0A3G5AEZ2_9VIRU|nr:MAG: hypothetical protein Satyrvirus36_10 [Satyrvirus sp.]